MPTPPHALRRRRVLGTLTAGALPLLLPACGGGDTLDPDAWRVTRDGLGGRTVLRLRSANAGLLAATDSGVFARVNGAWTSRQLSGEQVLDLLVLPDASASQGQRWLASTVRTGDGSHTPRLVESRNGGTTWQELPHSFGGPSAREAIHALGYDAVRGRLLATGVGVLAESDLAARHWQRLSGEWQGFGQPQSALRVEAGTGDVWWGGQNAIEELTLKHWRRANGTGLEYRNLMPAPSVVKGLQFSRTQANRLLVCGEGGVVQTVNGGQSWQPVIADEHRFYFDLVQDPLQPQRWVTARWIKTAAPQVLMLLRSDDDGKTWRSLHYGDADFFGGTWSLSVQVENNQAIYYLGLDKGGVARVEFTS